MGKAIYIAGQMSGIPEFNFPAFFAAENKLKTEGWKVFNPANKEAEKELDAEAFESGDHVLVSQRGFDFKEAYLWDLTKIIQSDAIFMLKGWERSPGAIGEHAVAVAIQKHWPAYEIIYE